MSVNLYIALEHPIHGTVPNAFDRVELARSQKALTTFAKAVGVKPLGDFYAYDRATLAQYLSEEELSSMQATEPTWFDPLDALRTVEALRAAIAADLDTAALDGPRALRELDDCARVLRLAADGQSRIRFYAEF